MTQMMLSQLVARSLVLPALLTCLGTLSACSVKKTEYSPELANMIQASNFRSSGTIILSQRPPAKPDIAAAVRAFGTEIALESESFSPLLGYFPPAATYLPADNETWLEVDREKKTISVYRGKNLIKKMQGEGNVAMNSGDYFLVNKQKKPNWYAPDQYFTKRELQVPESNDPVRYRKGALGKYALFPAPTFPIHCSQVWSEEVGGLRVSATDLQSVYYMLPVGAPVVIR